MGLAMFVGVRPLEEMSRRAHSTELKVIWASCEPEAPDMFPNRHPAKIGAGRMPKLYLWCPRTAPPGTCPRHIHAGGKVRV